MPARAFRLLAPAVLVHEGHPWQRGRPLDPPIGVAMPRLDGDRVLIDAVLTSTATCG